MRIRSRLGITALTSILAYLFALTGCTRSENAAAQQTAANAAASAGTSLANAPPTDAEIRAAVVEELFRSPHAHDGSIVVACNSGVVELTGSVNNLLAKDRAVAITEMVRGVRAVSDRLRVTPIARPDDELAAAVQTALLYDPAADEYQIKVGAIDGLVRLAGTVDSWEERRLAERLARGVRGVKAVQNQISVNPLSKRADADLKRDVESRLRWDAFVGDGLIQVKVYSGNVHLSGVVGSAAEKAQAYYDAWVHGARNVDAVALNVDPSARDDRLRGQKYAHKSDAEIVSALKDALVYDPRVDSAKVTVRADAGVITLAGEVRSAKAKLAAESVAQHTVGVRGLHDELQVKPGKPIADPELHARLKAALAASPVLDARALEAKVDHGEVTLSGVAGTLFESAEAVDIVSSFEGVTKVSNHLTVTSPEIAFVWVEHVFPFGPYVPEGHYAASSAAQSDRDIRQNIEREFSASPFVDADQVHVDVRDGKATLTGTVESWQERRAAGENALEGGAVSVDNQLKVG